MISELELEKKIGSRISDGCWEKEKIIFEIQCSRISVKEVTLRCQDYLNRGYSPVWILHDKIFNKRTVSSAEAYLRKYTPTFFTNGAHWYDQFEVCGEGKRWFKGPKLIVDLDHPVKITPLAENLLAQFRDWSCCFKGDFLHFLMTHPRSETTHFKKITHTLVRKYKRRGWIEMYRRWLYKILDQITW